MLASRWSKFNEAFKQFDKQLKALSTKAAPEPLEQFGEDPLVTVTLAISNLAISNSLTFNRLLLSCHRIKRLRQIVMGYIAFYNAFF